MLVGLLLYRYPPCVRTFQCLTGHCARSVPPHRDSMKRERTNPGWPRWAGAGRGRGRVGQGGAGRGKAGQGRAGAGQHLTNSASL